MNSMLTRRLMDAFHEAAGVPALMPPLPSGMTSQYVHVIDAIAQIGEKKGSVRVSDVAECLHVSIPGITRSVRALEELGAVEKEKASGDRRVVHIALTPLGQTWFQIYVEEYHEKLSALLADIPEEEAEVTIQTISQVMERMRGNPIALTGERSTDQ